MSAKRFSFAHGSGANPKEGFLCPMCMVDLQSFHSLRKHFEVMHSTEDRAIMKNVRGMFFKAKEKIFSKVLTSNDANLILSMPYAAQSPQELDLSFWEPQETGMIKYHMDVFRCIRDARIDKAVVETNKLSIRLDKLLQMQEADQSKRKELEQTVVPWVQDEDVPFCVSCGDKFNLTRRRHHCRLCGAIMCSRCSIFLTHCEAEEMLNKKKQFNQITVKRLREYHPLEKDEGCGKMEIRICMECNNIVHQSQEKLNLEFTSSLLVKLYTKMTNAMDAGEKLRPEFQKMAESLNMGEEEYKLDKALEKRQHLMQTFEAVDVLSKKISVLNMEDEETPPSSGTQKLQHSVRKAACAYLQDNLLSLPSLPSAPKLVVLQSKRHAENEKRFRRQREEAQRLRQNQKKEQELGRPMDVQELAENTVPSQGQIQIATQQVEAIVGDHGWSASTVNPQHHHNDLIEIWEDPDNGREEDVVLRALKEQISYVEESLKQAEAAGLRSEATSLGRNLVELKSEYRRYTSRAFALSSSRNDGTPLKLLEETSGGCSGNGDEDVILHQIQYISKCIEDASAASEFDEVKLLTDNLHEIKRIYAERRKNKFS